MHRAGHSSAALYEFKSLCYALPAQTNTAAFPLLVESQPISLPPTSAGIPYIVVPPSSSSAMAASSSIFVNVSNYPVVGTLNS